MGAQWIKPELVVPVPLALPILFYGPSARQDESLMIMSDDQLTTYECVCVFGRSRWTICKYCGLCVSLTLAATAPWYIAPLAVELLLLVDYRG